MNKKSINAIIGIAAFSAYGPAAQAHTFGAEGAGFIVAASLVHAIGIKMAVLIKRHLWLTKAGGLAIAAAGLYLTAVTI